MCLWFKLLELQSIWSEFIRRFWYAIVKYLYVTVQMSVDLQRDNIFVHQEHFYIISDFAPSPNSKTHSHIVASISTLKKLSARNSLNAVTWGTQHWHVMYRETIKKGRQWSTVFKHWYIAIKLFWDPVFTTLWSSGLHQLQLLYHWDLPMHNTKVYLGIYIGSLFWLFCIVEKINWNCSIFVRQLLKSWPQFLRLSEAQSLFPQSAFWSRLLLIFF